jgi:hypothetical protein
MIQIHSRSSKHLDRQTMSRGRLWTSGAAAILVSAMPFLSGCAGVLVAGDAVMMAKALPSNEPHWVETNRLTFAYPVDDVFALVVQGVERNGRKIVERSAESHSVLISYPFSWLKNNWGGSLKIACVTDEFGTTVTIQGDGRDVVPHVRAIGDEVLMDVDKALRRQPRSL